MEFSNMAPLTYQPMVLNNFPMCQWMCGIGSVASLVLGIVDLIIQFTRIRFGRASVDCDFSNCNAEWRTLITLSPDVFMDTFQPILLGAVGISIALPPLYRDGLVVRTYLPSSLWGVGLYHIIMALFANLGYLYIAGIVICALNLLFGVIFILVAPILRLIRNSRDNREKVTEMANRPNLNIEAGNLSPNSGIDPSEPSPTNIPASFIDRI
jgi:hypothetical protein